MCFAEESYFDTYRTYLEIDLQAIIHNGAVAHRQFPEQKILSVLKADAYGHGIAGILPAYEAFTDAYAVATVEEGLKIRQGSEKPVLLFGPVPTEQMVCSAQNHLTFTVGSLEYACRLSEKMVEAGISCQCHMKIDTGLHRSGIPYDATQQLRQIYSLPGLEFTGTYTHFACGEGTEDWELEFTQSQFDKFQAALQWLSAEKLPVGLRHCCSTGGALVHPQYRMDMVRLGMLPLGMSYSDQSVRQLGLKPVAKWVSYVAQIKSVAKGEAVSYGCTFRAEADMQVALVTCGYADGYRRVYSNKTEVLLHGKTVPVVGRVAMDYLMIDVTGVADVCIGDPVILLGADRDAWISAQQLAQYGESVSGEVTCAISARVPRVYLNEPCGG